MKLSDSVNLIKGIGTARASAFEKVGVYELRDFLRYFPRNYTDKSVIKRIADTAPMESCTVLATVKTTPVLSRLRGGLTTVRFNIVDDSGTCQVT